MNFSTDFLRALLGRMLGYMLVCLSGAIVAVPATALAQDEAPREDNAARGDNSGQKDEPQEPRGPRFSETFEPAGTDVSVRLQVEPTVSNDRWEVHIVSGDLDDEDKPAKTELREQLPRWIVDQHYGFEIVSESLGGGVSAVILAALPGVHGDGPPAATQFQVIWVVEQKRGELRWRRLDTAQSSPLDGGERFEFRQEGSVHRLVRRRRGSESIFCGDSSEDPVLFDLYDPGEQIFEQKLDIERLVAGTPTLKATRALDAFEPPALQAWFQWFAASSDRRSPNRRGALIRPLELGDGRAETAWMEGVDGLGRGEFVSAQVNDAAALESIRIVPGAGAEKHLFDAYARPKRLLVGLSDGSRFIVELGDVDHEQVKSGKGVTVELPEPKKTRCLSVMLLDAEPGRAVRGQPSWTRETTVIAEITPYSEFHAEDAQKTARQIVDAIANEEDPRSRQRIAELGSSIEKQLVVEVRRAVDNGSADKRRRIIPLMGSLPASEAVPMLMQFLRQTDTSAPEYRAIKRSLAAHYTAAAPGLVKFLREESPTDRKHTDVLRLLGRVGEPAHLIVLVDALGQGETVVRNERVRAIGAGGEPLVEPLVVHAREHADTDAGYDALRTLHLLGRRLHYTGQGELPQPELFGQMLDETKTRRSLMRALAVAKFFRVRGFVATTRETFSTHKDALVRRAAIEALERYPSDAARELLVRALSDASPDVRIAAVSALGQRDDVSKSVDDVLDYSRTERWKAGLKQAFRMLAAVDNQATTEAFEALFRDAPNSDAALWAAQALDRARRPVRADLAQALIENPDVVLELRLEMLDLLGLDTSESGERFLLDALDNKRWTEFAEATRARNQLRDHVMLSLGRRRSQAAMPKLLEVARADESTEVRQVALRALAFYQDESLLAELVLWKANAKPELQGSLDQTITMIERRRSLSSVESDLAEVLEEAEKSETNDPDGASNDPDSDED